MSYYFYSGLVQMKVITYFIILLCGDDSSIKVSKSWMLKGLCPLYGLQVGSKGGKLPVTTSTYK